MAWYNSLMTAEKIYFWVAVVGTVLLVLQIVLMLFSFGGADADAPDGDVDVDVPDGDLGISLFTIKGITAFLAIGGWVGLLILQINPDNVALSIVLALVCGLLSMFLVALALKGIAKLQCNGNLEKDKLVGKEATVYVSVAPSRTGRGKIVLVAQGAYTEMDAVTDETEKLAVDEKVVITEIGNDYMVVRRVSAAENSDSAASGSAQSDEK